jgi:hypothetical protein
MDRSTPSGRDTFQFTVRFRGFGYIEERFRPLGLQNRMARGEH